MRLLIVWLGLILSLLGLVHRIVLHQLLFSVLFQGHPIVSWLVPSCLRWLLLSLLVVLILLLVQTDLNHVDSSGILELILLALHNLLQVNLICLRQRLP